jgi:hypothetical protein
MFNRLPFCISSLWCSRPGTYRMHMWCEHSHLTHGQIWRVDTANSALCGWPFPDEMWLTPLYQLSIAAY